MAIAQNSAAEDYSFEEDKQKHFALSALFSMGSETILEFHNDRSLDESDQLNGIELITYSTLIGLVPGVLKEASDASDENNEWSNADLVYDFAGALAGSALSYSLHRLFKDDYRVSLFLGQYKKQVFISYTF